MRGGVRSLFTLLGLGALALSALASNKSKGSAPGADSATPLATASIPPATPATTATVQAPVATVAPPPATTPAPLAAADPAPDVRYRARLGAQDHVDSKGIKLVTPNEVLQMDRANYHRFMKRDPEDQDDPIFVDLVHRDNFIKYLAPLPADVSSAIDARTPLVDVLCYKHGDGYVVKVVLAE